MRMSFYNVCRNSARTRPCFQWELMRETESSAGGERQSSEVDSICLKWDGQLTISQMEVKRKLACLLSSSSLHEPRLGRGHVAENVLGHSSQLDCSGDGCLYSNCTRLLSSQLWKLNTSLYNNGNCNIRPLAHTPSLHNKYGLTVGL